MTHTFIDLFAGIGGFRIGFEAAGLKCVMSSEINSHARDVYIQNFGDVPRYDVAGIHPALIPSHDILLAGFPCQPFSAAGKRLGFEDTRGTLFFNIAKIVTEKRPRAVVLENVKNFSTHDGGRTLDTVLSTLRDAGYIIAWKVLNAADFGVPQNRERIIIVASRDGVKFDFTKLNAQPRRSIDSILEPESGRETWLQASEYTLIPDTKVQKSGLVFAGYRNKTIRRKGVRPGTVHLSRVHRQPNRIYSSTGTHPTLSSKESSGRYFVEINGRVRKLSLRECFRLMGFPDEYEFAGPISKMYNRIGNSIAVPMITSIAHEVVAQLFTSKQEI